MTTLFCFPGTKHKKLGPDKPNKKSVTDRDINVFKVSRNLKKSSNEKKKDLCSFIYKSVHTAKQIPMAELLAGEVLVTCMRCKTRGPMFSEAHIQKTFSWSIFKLQMYGPRTDMV